MVFDWLCLLTIAIHVCGIADGQLNDRSTRRRGNYDKVEKDTTYSQHNTDHDDSDENYVVEVKQGKLRGTTISSRGGCTIYAFYNIPYAKPPIGRLRFRCPKPPDSWEGIRDATEHGPMCIQRNAILLDNGIKGEEDCLYLNVFTTGTTCFPKPVMIFFHGGAWATGTGRDYEPTNIVDKKVVLVTLNYRLGVLGFLSTGDKACPGNNGLKDQLAALKWVKENIIAFGGNPNAITLFGEAAGGVSVHFHMLSPASRGLFKRAISQSGNAFCPWALVSNSLASKNAKKLGRLFKCPTDKSRKLINCLRKKEASAIVDSDKNFQEPQQLLFSFRPVIEKVINEDTFLPASLYSLVFNYSESHQVAWMLGLNSHEGCDFAARLFGLNLVKDFDKRFTTLAPQHLYYGDTSTHADEISAYLKKYYFGKKPINERTRMKLVDMFTDGLILHGTIRALRNHARVATSPLYLYYFTYRGSRSFSELFGDPDKDYGVCIRDEMLYLFPHPDIFSNATYTENDEKMVDIMTKYWTNFAKYGNPTAKSNSVWHPVVSTHRFEYAEINNNGIRNYRGLLEDRVACWDSFPLDD